MWMPAITTAAPAAEPITLDQAKAQLRGIAGSDGPYVEALIGAARGHVERYTGLRLVRQTVELRASRFADLAHFDIGPIATVESIRYLDEFGVAQTLDPASWERFGADLEQGVRPKFGGRWPATRPVEDAIVVTAIAGFEDTAAVPLPIVQAMLLLVGDWYQNREDTIAERSVTPAAMPNGVATLLSNWRMG